MRTLAACGLGGFAVAIVSACGGPTPLDAKALRDPQACQSCHPGHYEEWSSSMHAYASDDPVFVAMNRRAQRETNGALGTFCLQCHAPMAVRDGATTDGSNLADLPREQKGVTCFFCHSISEVQGTHDAPLVLATDGAFRAAIKDPLPAPHGAIYAPLQDREQPAAATLCGSCHDIVNQHGGHVERTYEEWQATLFAHDPTVLTCGQCHMTGHDGLAAETPGSTMLRRIHAHDFPAVDTVLSPVSSTARASVQRELDTTLQTALCVKGANAPGQTRIQLVVDNVAAGHRWPSGATPDRRAWVELKAYSKGTVLYDSGVVADGQSVLDLADPDLWLVRDCLFDDGGKQVDFFWQASSYDSNQLPGPVTSDPTDPRYYSTHVVQTYPRASATGLAFAPDRVTVRVRLVPIGLDVLDQLVQSGDLDASLRDAMPTYSLGGTELEWTDAAATIRYPDGVFPVSCVTSGLTTGANNGVPAPRHTRCKP